MYTEQMTQALAIAGAPIHPQILTGSAALNTGSVDLALCKRCLFILDMGVLGGTSPTLSAVLTIQESADESSWSNNGTVSTLTLTAGTQIGTSEIRADQLGVGKRYVRAAVVYTIGGTSPTVPTACLPLGDAAAHRPANRNNDPSVATQVVTN